MVERKPYIPFLLAAGAFGACIALTAFGPPDAVSFTVFLAVAGCLIALNPVLEPSVGAPLPLLRVLFLFLVGALIGVGSYQSRRLAERTPRGLVSLGEVTALECELTGDPLPFGKDRSRVPVRVSGYKTAAGGYFSAAGRASIIIDNEYARGNYPGRLTLEGDKILSAGLRTDFPGSFLPVHKGESAGFLASRWDGTGSWSDGSGGIRSNMRKSLTGALLARGESGGLLLALLSGNRDYLEESLAPAFRSAGLSHVLALSGMHLSIIALIIIRFGRGLGQDRLSIRLSLFAMLFFVWFAGPSPSLVRAVMMALILFLTRALGYKASPLAVLLLTAVIQLALFPADAVSPAFALSYGALAGIFAFSGPLADILPARIPPALRSAVTASVGAQLATAGYTAAVFGTFVPFAFVAAVIVSPLATVFLSSGIIWLVLYLVSPNLGILLYPFMEGQYRFLASLVRRFAALPYVEIRDLSGILVTVILSFALAVCILAAFHITRKGRLPDAGFAGL